MARAEAEDPSNISSSSEEEEQLNQEEDEEEQMNDVVDEDDDEDDSDDENGAGSDEPVDDDEVDCVYAKARKGNVQPLVDVIMKKFKKISSILKDETKTRHWNLKTWQALENFGEVMERVIKQYANERHSVEERHDQPPSSSLDDAHKDDPSNKVCRLSKKQKMDSQDEDMLVASPQDEEVDVAKKAN